MGEYDSLLKTSLLLGSMAALAVVEALIPLREAVHPRGPRLRRNLALTAITLALNLLLTASVVGVALWMERREVGVLRWLALPGVVSFALSILLLDFFAYLVHVLLHMSPRLWRMHRVHHSDLHVDVTTAFRQHPMEGLLRFVFTFVPAILLGASATATAAYRLLSALNALLEHSNLRVWPWLDRALRWLVVTPDMHKIHHSRQAIETDSNYANIFSLHDRLFGTYTPTERASGVRYGLEDSSGKETLIDLLKLPWQPAPPVSGAPAKPARG